MGGRGGWNKNIVFEKMSAQSYVTKITDKPPKFRLICRYICSGICELEEYSKDSIDMIGYYNVDVRKSCYSSKLSLEAMRVIAGSDKLKGYYLNKRFEFFWDKEHAVLAKLIFP